jgi:integrase/recombinase XerD
VPGDEPLHSIRAQWSTTRARKERIVGFTSLLRYPLLQNDGYVRAQWAVFLNNRRQPLTRFGIYTLVHGIVAQASTTMPSLKAKRISPHSVRHTAAVHLLRAGVDINTIRAWLGHVSLDTTNVYAEIDLEMKAKALASCDISDEVTQKRRRKQADLMTFLQGL